MVNTFQIIGNGYRTNRELVSKLYADANVENLFDIIEDELMYTGSMGEILKEVAKNNSDLSTVLSLILKNFGNCATITTQYALCEKIIITKENLEMYDELTGIMYATKTYFALFPAIFPEKKYGSGLFALQFDEFASPTSASIIEITSTKNGTATDNNNDYTYIEIEADDIDGNIIDSTNLDTYISPLLYEKFDDSTSDFYIEIEGKPWYGERIHKTTIYLENSTIKMSRYIPSIQASYTINIMDNVKKFSVIENTNVYKVIIKYELTESTETITKTRKFFKSGG